jgi:type II secretory pathway component GspD/PulD (secretin)
VSVSTTQIGRHLFGLSTGSALRTESIQLSCLSPQQAGDIISPYVRSNGSAYYAANSDLSVITVRGTPDELAKSRELIRQLDADPRAACRFTMGDKLIELQDQVEKAVEARHAAEAAAAAAADAAPVLAAPKK